jgi:hypothetical protein
MSKLAKNVQVSIRFQRSIRIDTDLSDEAIVNSFVCPQSSVEILLTMALGRKNGNEAAFTWTGPFGSGKSSLVVILNALLGDNKRLRDSASKIIGQKNADKILESFNVTEKKKWKFVPVVGSRVNICQSLITALKTLFEFKSKITEHNISETLTDLSKNEECGIFIVFDEMGKFLEGAAGEKTDIYIFQQLAELASRSKGKIIILGILHQSFAEYAKRLARDIRDEWAKIQGRFVDLPLNVAGEELIDLIGTAIKSDKKPVKSTEFAKTTAKEISFWKHIHTESLEKSLTNCWPLHPIVASLLGPISRRRFGQNQRSVFAFLNSSEPYGFQDFLNKTELSTENVYSPTLLWDYLKANLEPSIMASPDGHKWSLALDALFRSEAISNDKDTLPVLKCIALMDIFQERSGLSPNKNILQICFPDISSKDLDAILEKLCQHSTICFRKHKKAYSLHQGSDFDIDSAAEEAYKQIPTLDFNRIKQSANFQPIVAKKHYHETGSLRWFDVDLVPAEQAQNIAKNYSPKNGSIGLFMIIIATSENEDADNICLEASALNSEWPIFVSLANNSLNIRSLAKELQALDWIRNNNLSLGSDGVARREVESRAASVRDSLEQHLSGNLNRGTWYIEGKAAIPLSFKELHSLASEKANSIFPKSPKINSELVNRVKPSGNSMGGLKILLNAMIEKNGQPRLGIEGYPAEGGLFETLLSITGIYRQSKNEFTFSAPSEKNDKARCRPIWEAADHFFEKNPNRSMPITELYKIWTEKPLGVKDGLLSFFSVAYLLSRKHDFAIYHAGHYRPSIDELFIDYLIKTPEDISLRSMNFSDIGQKILAGISNTLNKFHSEMPTLSETSEPLEVAQRLVMTVLNLHPWVLKTRQLSNNAIRLRELIKNAHDPNKVLFDDLPHLFKEFEGKLKKGDVQPIIEELEKNLNELVQCYPTLVSSFRKQLLDELQVEVEGKLANEEILLRSKNILHISGDFKLDAFAIRLSTFENTDTEIESLMSLAADKPSKDWIDLDVNRAKLRIAELAQKFNHTEAYGRVQNREDFRQAVAFMIGLDSSPKTFNKEFTIKQSQKKIVSQIENRLLRSIAEEKGIEDNLILAALANIGARILEKDQSA